MIAKVLATGDEIHSRRICRRVETEKGEQFGNAFEHFIYLEMLAHKNSGRMKFCNKAKATRLLSRKKGKTVNV